MSAFLAIVCDSCSSMECVTKPAPRGNGAPLPVQWKRLREDARAKGWDCTEGRDVCPKHTTSMGEAVRRAVLAHGGDISTSSCSAFLKAGCPGLKEEVEKIRPTSKIKKRLKGEGRS